MVMGMKIERSAEAIQHAREDRDGWLFAFLTVGTSCAVVIIGLASAYPWH